MRLLFSLCLIQITENIKSLPCEGEVAPVRVSDGVLISTTRATVCEAQARCLRTRRVVTLELLPLLLA